MSFIKKAGTLILIASVVVWALSTLPGGDIETERVWPSFGRALEPVGALMGLGDWQMIVALITSFFAKENTIATLGVLYGGGAGTAALAAQVAAVLVPAARGGLPGGADALHPLPGDRRRRSSRRRAHGAGRGQHRDDAGDLA